LGLKEAQGVDERVGREEHAGLAAWRAGDGSEVACPAFQLEWMVGEQSTCSAWGGGEQCLDKQRLNTQQG